MLNIEFDSLEPGHLVSHHDDGGLWKVILVKKRHPRTYTGREVRVRKGNKWETITYFNAWSWDVASQVVSLNLTNSYVNSSTVLLSGAPVGIVHQEDRPDGGSWLVTGQEKFAQLVARGDTPHQAYYSFIVMLERFLGNKVVVQAPTRRTIVYGIGE